MKSELSSESVHRSAHGKRTGRRLCCVAFTLLALVGFAYQAQAQDAEFMSELKETIKQELLQELRSEAARETVLPAYIEKLKEELKNEILAELKRQEGDARREAIKEREKLKQELRRELLQNMESEPEHPQRVRFASGNVGDAEGQILRRGLGLPEVRVKLVRLLGTSGMSRGYREDEEYETVTDEKGRYYFHALPVGAFKLKWELPWDRGWIRRLRDEPDVVVGAGQTRVLKDVETSRALVPQ